MEADVLKTLSYEMGNPTVKSFLRCGSGVCCIICLMFDLFVIGVMLVDTLLIGVSIFLFCL